VFSITCHTNYALVFLPFSKYQLFAEILPFKPTPLLVSQSGMTPLEFYKDLWCQKTRIPLQLCGVVCVIMSLALVIQNQLTTD